MSKTGVMVERSLETYRITKGPSVLVADSYRPSWQIACSKCPATARRVSRNVDSMEQILGGFRSYGWIVSHKALCPNCQTKESKVSAPTTADAISIAALKAICPLLDSHYVREAKAYVSGASDRLLADRTKFSVEIVRKIREELYGPVIDPELDSLKSEFATLQTMVTDFGKRLAKLEARK